MKCAIRDDGRIDESLNWVDVESHVDDTFLRAANEALSSSFSRDDPQCVLGRYSLLIQEFQRDVATIVSGAIVNGENIS